MYIITYRKHKWTRELPFKNLAQANIFIKTCIDNNWLILEFKHKETEQI